MKEYIAVVKLKFSAEKDPFTQLRDELRSLGMDSSIETIREIKEAKR